MLHYYLFILVVYSISTLGQIHGWDVPSSNQYHIQTDEGPERYFRYQTDSGQYRKEKRLEDGTVVGTYAWIDANGFLRQEDYIADNGGYRILKTKNLFVGRNVPVGQAVKSAAKYATSSYLNTNQRPVVTVPYNTFKSDSLQSTTPSSVITNTPLPYGAKVPSNILSTTPSSIITSTEAPVVEITPNSVYSTTINSLLVPLANSTGAEQITNYISSTPFPPSSYYQPTTPTTNYLPSTQTPYESAPQVYGFNQVPKEVNQNSIEYNPYNNQIDNSYRFHNGPTYPLDQNGNTYFGRNIGNEYDSQNYDGVSVTNDGFRYYIPRAYHEEQTLPGDKRSGSFGYIDPFGIRRVIYYNTAPGTGFQHRKNNRYVGFQATPYDPRPY